MAKKTKRVAKKAVDGKSAAANDQPKSEATVTKKGLAARTAGLKLYISAGRPSHADFRKVFGKDGGKLTWAQRAEEVGLSSAEECAAKFQSMLAKAGK